MLNLFELFKFGPKFDVPYELKVVAQDTFATGSRIICSPPPMDTDLDVVVLVDSPAAIVDLETLGYVVDSSSPEYEDAVTVPMRKGDVNLIVMWDKETFVRWRLATDVARELNLLDRNDRLACFRVIRSSTLIKST